METHIPATDDERHNLAKGEHEAFYFIFSQPDGSVFGYLRTLFGHDDLLEMVALRAGDHTWAHQARYPWPSEITHPEDASGPHLKFLCRSPWESWTLSYKGTLTAGNESIDLDLAFQFQALNEPALYRFGGSYHQVQQDGIYTGTLKLGEHQWSDHWISGRDHSWGRRPMEVVLGTTGIVLPDRAYLMLVQTPERSTSFGRVRDAENNWQAAQNPTWQAAAAGGQFSDPAAGLPLWKVERLVPPLISHYGRGGEEAIRDHSEPGDFLKDEIGPALYTGPQGEQIVGIFDQTRKVG
jgi:hypothetical protein